MNIGELADNLGLEVEEYMELLELFFQTGAADLEKLQTAVTEGDVENAINASHSLKGASGNLGIMDLHLTAKQIEDDARNGQMDGIAEAVQSLETKFKELNHAAGQI